ncbi:MAG: CopG family ribbon-helix-helix protein, partial [Terriglobia bacterium]
MMLYTGGHAVQDTVTIRVDAETKQRLDQLAKATERTRSYLAAEAIRQYLELNEWQIREIQQAIVEADATKPEEWISHEEVMRKIKTLARGKARKSTRCWSSGCRGQREILSEHASRKERLTSAVISNKPAPRSQLLTPFRDLTLRFINELRTAGLRISISESMDALRAVAAIGVERDMFCEALAACLVKEEEDRLVFDETFARFFAGPAPQRRGKRHEKSGEQGEKRQAKTEGVGSRPQEKPQQQRPSQQPPQSPQERPDQPSQHESVPRSSDVEPVEGESTTGHQPEEDETGFKARLSRQKVLLE